jgi:acyl carrier protein
MPKNKNLERLQQVVATVMNVSPSEVDDDTSPDTLPAWDSLSHIDLIVAVESEFNVSLSAEDSMEMLSVRLIRLILDEHGVSLDGG